MQELSLHILDLARNSVVAGAKLITVSLACQGPSLVISIADDGKGMDEKTAEAVSSPFATSRTTRRVGLGIPLFKTAAEQCGGTFNINSKTNEGTTVTGSFVINSIDRQPLGDLGETMLALIVSEQNTDFVLELKSDKEDYRFDTREIKAVMGDLSLHLPEVTDWMMDHMNEGIRTVFGGVLNEIDTGIRAD